MYLEVPERLFLKVKKKLEEKNIKFRVVNSTLLGDKQNFYRFEFGETNVELAKEIFSMYTEIVNANGNTVPRTEWAKKYLNEVKIKEDRLREDMDKKDKEDERQENFLGL